MAVIPDGGPEGVTITGISTVGKHPDGGSKEKAAGTGGDGLVEVVSEKAADSDYDDAAKIYVPRDDEQYIDPRLKDYPVPLVAKTVDLHNDFR